MGHHNCMLPGIGLVSSKIAISCAKDLQVPEILQLFMQFLIIIGEVNIELLRGGRTIKFR